MNGGKLIKTVECYNTAGEYDFLHEILVVMRNEVAKGSKAH